MDNISNTQLLYDVIDSLSDEEFEEFLDDLGLDSTIDADYAAFKAKKEVKTAEDLSEKSKQAKYKINKLDISDKEYAKLKGKTINTDAPYVDDLAITFNPDKSVDIIATFDFDVLEDLGFESDEETQSWFETIAEDLLKDAVYSEIDSDSLDYDSFDLVFKSPESLNYNKKVVSKDVRKQIQEKLTAIRRKKQIQEKLENIRRRKRIQEKLEAARKKVEIAESKKAESNKVDAKKAQLKKQIQEKLEVARKKKQIQERITNIRNNKKNK